MRHLTRRAALVCGLLSFVLSASASMTGCGSGEPSPPPAEDRTYPISPDRPTNATCLAPDRPPPRGLLALERRYEDVLGDHQQRAIQLAFSEHDGGHWYVARQTGQIVTFGLDDDASTLALDIADRMWFDHPETGLMSISLAPDFETSGHAYLVYSAPDPGGVFFSRLSRFTSHDGGTTFDPDSELVLVDVPETTGAHNGNHTAFDHDGHLLYSIGDGAFGIDPFRHGQNAHTFYGTMLRLDVSGPDEARGTPYSIPADNPFADGVDGAPEVFAYGLRNPWRFSVDAETGEIWEGDVGENTREEINLIVAGGNYGWSEAEGSTCFRDPACDLDQWLAPVFDYARESGSSVTGGFVYRGSAIGKLVGRYVFGDFVSGNIFALREDEDGAVAADLQIETGLGVASFAEGPGRELFFVAYDREGASAIYQLVDVGDPEPSTFPTRLSETGCVDVADPGRAIDGVFAYDVIAPLWSDGADKERFLAIPDDRRIAVDDDGDMQLPRGTVLIKHFAFDGRYHETRLFVHHDDGWAGYSYRWLPDQSDAELIETSLTAKLANGQTWTWPARSRCFECHTQASGRSLGLETAQLARDGQLERLLAQDYFVPDIDSLDALPMPHGPLAAIDDPSATPELRARSYLHANCAACHRPGGTTTPANFDLRFGVALDELGVCDVDPEHGTFWMNKPEWRILRPGRVEDSLVSLRMRRRDVFQMPPLATRLVDTAGADIVDAWITGLSSCP